MPLILQPDTEQDAPQRVVSLVPSLTESLFDLGFGDTLVGVTDFCTEPAAARQIAHVGGPKTLSIKAIIDLSPDLVVANQEENSRDDVQALVAAGIKVWLSFPCTVQQMLADLFTLASLFRSDPAFMRVRFLEQSLAWARSAAESRQPVRTFCPIWYENDGEEPWWMTFNRETYSHDLLNCLGFMNIFANRQRLYPLAADLGKGVPEDPAGRDTRYPHVLEQEVITAQPDLVLLPSEPYPFDETMRKLVQERFSATPAVGSGRIILVDGSLLTWHGTRLAKALAELPAWLDEVTQ
ncbi:MAG TPA: helical backbone metal receptor [Anaerolineaceae bacterium]|nr:helical backbone metal receptor [Anaerolineaceae bacterium]